MDHTEKTVAVCATTRPGLDAVAALVRRTNAYEPAPVLWPDRDGLARVTSLGPCAFIVAASAGDASAELAAEVQRQAAETPLLAFGESPMTGSAVCWMKEMPSPYLLAALLAQIAVASPLTNDSDPPPSRAWRRKSDMIVGTSVAMNQLLAMLDRLAPSVAPVLISGESGTGKELVARALHYTGPRARAPFVALNCGAIPENLFEAELFGYQRGAFTGAVTARPGAFEAADDGTLFLDEIGEMPLAMQVKLLRVLETGVVTRLGSNDSKKLDVRLVTATNRKLEDEIKAGRFREDLFYRVSVYPVHVPPLRERPEDIAPLVTHYLEEIARRESRPTPRLTHAGLEKILSHRWPGNVRELVNTLERALLISDRGVVDSEHLVLPDDATPVITSYKEAKEKFEERYYAQLLKAAAGNVSLAAKLASKTRKEVYDALRRIGFAADSYRDSSARMPVASRAREDE